MISKNLSKLIRSLEQKKNRQREGLFVAEGPKVVSDLMQAFTPRLIVATDQWLNEQRTPPACQTFVVSNDELRRTSFLQHPQQVLALFHLPHQEITTQEATPEAETTQAAMPSPTFSPRDELILALDGVQDPGNLGTIIRIADWFGVRTLLCSTDTADAYNPKVVQATMGSLARVHIIYIDLLGYLTSLPSDIPLYGTFLDGTDIYHQPLTHNGIVIMGNEGKGISPSVGALINRRLLIPHYSPEDSPADASKPDSLNVAIATALTCAEFRRQATKR